MEKVRIAAPAVRPLRGGRLTIPCEFRPELGIADDTQLELTLVDDEARIRPVEVRVVLRRPELARRFSTPPGSGPEAVSRILDAAELVPLDEDAIPRMSRDVKDDKCPAAAKAGNAAYLVSEDEDLLVLQTYEDVRIVLAATFLRLLQPGSPRTR